MEAVGPWMAGMAEPLAIRAIDSTPASHTGPVENLAFSSINPVFDQIAPTPPTQTAGFGFQRVSWGGSR